MLARLAIVALAALWVTALSEVSEGLPQGEVLYNGIRLPTPWPPRVAELTAEPTPVPYLTSLPAVIPIDVGRQLFVDDFLVESTTLKRAFHSAEYYKGNPVLRPDKPWEQTGRDPCAMVFSDGVWYDPQDRLFKMWYMGGYVASTCYATSRDGVHWEKPALDVKPGTNVVMEGWRDSSTVWLDLEEKDPAKRYKMFRVGKEWRVLLYFSADGIHWGEPAAKSAPTGDRTTVFWNPFRKVWVYSLRANSNLGRSRQYFESSDALAGANWKPGEPVWWTAADRLDKPRDDLKTQPQLYNLDAVAYESLMVGLFTIWRGQPAERPKPNEVLICFSRDGFHWDRTNRRSFIPVSETKGDGNWGNVQSCGGCCLVVGDKLFFYVSGRRGVPGTSSSGECATGLATLRRDGFASMDVAGSAGTLTTRPVRFTGKHLFVNVDAGGGELRAEALDESGRAVEPFTAANCQAVRGDTTRAAVRWTGAEDLAPLAGKPVRFRFHLTAGRLYSFWVSSEKAGASRGYVAAGGPGFTASTDTVGEAALKAVGDR